MVSGNVVVREIDDEIIIIPFASGIDNTGNEPSILNKTGQAVWQRVDGRRRMKDIVADLAAEFQTPAGVIEKDVIVFVKKLLKRKMLVEISEI